MVRASTASRRNPRRAPNPTRMTFLRRRLVALGGLLALSLAVGALLSSLTAGRARPQSPTSASARAVRAAASAPGQPASARAPSRPVNAPPQTRHTDASSSPPHAIRSSTAARPRRSRGCRLAGDGACCELAAGAGASHGRGSAGRHCPARAVDSFLTEACPASPKAAYGSRTGGAGLPEPVPLRRAQDRDSSRPPAGRRCAADATAPGHPPQSPARHPKRKKASGSPNALFSASGTCRLQRRSLFTYLSELITAHNRGDPFPSLAT